MLVEMTVAELRCSTVMEVVSGMPVLRWPTDTGGSARQCTVRTVTEEVRSWDGPWDGPRRTHPAIRARRLPSHPLAGQLHPRAGTRRARPGQPARGARHRSAARLGIPGTVRVSVPSQRGLRLLHSALRPTTGQARRPSHADARGPDHHDPAHGAARRGRVRWLSARRWLPPAPGVGEGNPILANRRSRIMRRRVATHKVRANALRQTISGTCRFGA
jgi:hypothetical protein